MTAPTPTREDRIEAIAARLAYWWRMSFSDDYSEPECDMGYWMGAARMAARAYEDALGEAPDA